MPDGNIPALQQHGLLHDWKGFYYAVMVFLQSIRHRLHRMLDLMVLSSKWYIVATCIHSSNLGRDVVNYLKVVLTYEDTFSFCSLQLLSVTQVHPGRMLSMPDAPLADSQKARIEGPPRIILCKLF